MRNKIEGLVVAAAFAVLLINPKPALATCTTDPDQNTPICNSQSDCCWGYCEWDWGVSASGGFVCKGGIGMYVKGQTTQTGSGQHANCDTLMYVDGGPDHDNAALCIGRDTMDPCDGDGQCASGICQPDSGVELEWSGTFNGYCVPQGYDAGCAIGYKAGTLSGSEAHQVDPNAGCDSGVCVLHDSAEGVCGLPYRDAGISTAPCEDTSYCWAPGGYTCDLTPQSPNEYTCVAACQSHGSECQDAGLNDCCGTDRCVNSVCVACVPSGGSCTTRSECCQEAFNGAILDEEFLVCDTAVGGGECIASVVGSPCTSATDCQDSKWLCVGSPSVCLPIPAGITAGCTQNWDCQSGAECNGSGKCCFPVGTQIGNIGNNYQCCVGPGAANVPGPGFHC
jgi:hypothetical protein